MMQADHKTWEDILDENNVHDVVSDDSEMYAEIESIPNEDADMLSQVIGVIQNRVRSLVTATCH